MVDDPGHPWSEVEQLANESKRFPKPLSEAAEQKQLEEREKLLRKLEFPDFHPKSEEDFEEWVDTVSRLVSRYRVCLPLFQDAWESFCPEEFKDVVGRVSDVETHEELVAEVGTKLFRASTYVIDLEKMLLKGVRRESVLSAECWLKKYAARYARLCARKERCLGISNIQLQETALNCLPTEVRRQMKLERFRGPLKELFLLASQVEASLIDLAKDMPEPLGAMAADDDDVSMSGAAPKGSFNPCSACGSTRHKHKDCRFKEYRCLGCGKLGHIKRACKSIVEKDTKGRVLVRYTPSAAGAEVRFRKDRTTRDKLMSAEDVLTALREMVEGKSLKAKVKREAKQTHVPKKKKPEAPARVAEEGDDDSGESESEDGDDWTNIISKAVDIATAMVTDGPGNVRIPCAIEGVSLEAVADTGAAFCLCGTGIANRLRLKPSGEKKQFRGLGRQSGFKTRPVTVVVGDRSAEIEIYVVNEADFPFLLGVDGLKKLDVMVDPTDHKVRCRETSEVVALSWEEHEAIVKKTGLGGDTVSGVDESKSDEQLLNEARVIYDELTKHLDGQPAREEMWGLFKKYKGCWLRPRGGEVKIMKASFVVEGKPIKQKLRYMTPELQKELDKQLDEMLAKGIIRPSKSPWGSVPVFVKKKTGEYRLCLDYRQLNQRMKADSYPLPLIWENLQRAAHYPFYICLDCNWGFWNISLEESSKEYTAIISNRGAFEFNVLPFGIKNSPSEYQRAMDLIFGDLYGKGVLCYVDDIVIYARTLEEAMRLFEEVLIRCTRAGLYLKLKKSELIKPAVTLLGHIVSETGIKPHPRKVEAIKKAKAPTNKHELRSFLGTASYLRRFVPHFSALVAPLVGLLKKAVTFDWGEAQEEAFQELKDLLSEHVLLSAPIEEAQTVLVTDASDKGLGAVLMQVDKEGEIHVIEFASKSLSKAEQNWATIERELYAIKWAVDHFRDYVKGTMIYVVTDHQSLLWLKSSRNGKVERWALYLQQYNLKIIHLSGEANVMSDWLSRSTPDDPEEEAVIDTICVPSFAVEEATQEPWLPDVESLKAAYEISPREELRGTVEGEDGLKYSVRSYKLYVPPPLREPFLYWFHASRYGGHGGSNRTLRRMNKWVWWPAMHADVKAYVDRCLLCVRKGALVSKTLRSVLDRPMPFQLVSLDHVGPRKWGGREVHYLVIIDHCSRFVVAMVAEDCEADTTRDLMDKRWCSIFGAPEVVLTDRGPAFRGQGFTDYVTQKLGSYHMFTSPYYPRGNGINEACHISLESSLTAAAHSDVYQYAVALQDAVYAHNATPHVATGMSPFECLFGQEMVLPGWQAFQLAGDPEKRQLGQKEARYQALVRASILSQKVTVAHQPKFQVGDIVVFQMSKYERSIEVDKTDHSYDMRWSLPHRVKKIKGDSLQCVPMAAGEAALPRQVSASVTRALKPDIPASLVPATIAQLRVKAPRRPWQRPKDVSGRALAWSQVRSEIGQPGVKRSRPGFVAEVSSDASVAQ